MQVVVHGGAGSAPGNPSPRARALEASAVLGSRQPSPVDAVLEAIRSMEVDPQFNAGIGSAVQSDGEIRTDAGIMTMMIMMGLLAVLIVGTGVKSSLKF